MLLGASRPQDADLERAWPTRKCDERKRGSLGCCRTGHKLSIDCCSVISFRWRLILRELSLWFYLFADCEPTFVHGSQSPAHIAGPRLVALRAIFCRRRHQPR